MRDMSAMTSMPPQSGPTAPDMEKVYKSELENLQLAEGQYRWVGDGIEERVLATWGKR